MSEPPPKADTNSSHCGRPGHGACQPAQCRVNRVNLVNLIFDRLWLAAPRAVAPRDAFHRREGPAVCVSRRWRMMPSPLQLREPT
jgi:hypothetical protein